MIALPPIKVTSEKFVIAKITLADVTNKAGQKLNTERTTKPKTAPNRSATKS